MLQYSWIVTLMEMEPAIPSDAINLGLPSGTLWCSHNVGANSQEEYGLYFSWGNTTGYYYENTSYDFSSTTYNNSDLSQISTSISPDSGHDAARIKMKHNWRMPTSSELTELNNNTNKTWESVNGIYGVRFTSKISGYTNKSIFIPAGGSRTGTNTYNAVGEQGYIWSSTMVNSSNAYGLGYIQTSIYVPYSYSKSNGMNIRPVISG